MNSSQDVISTLEKRAFALVDQGHYPEAIADLQRVVELDSASGGAHANLGVALCRAGLAVQALDSFRTAVSLAPHDTAIWLNIANLLALLGQPVSAIQSLREAQANFPKDAAVHYAAGELLYAQGLRGEAVAAFQSALSADPAHAKARWMIAIAALPQAYGPGEDPAVARIEFEAALHELDEWFDESRLPLATQSVSVRQPFYLAYMEQDNRTLLSAYGDLCARLLRGATPSAHLNDGGTRSVVRVAVVTAFVCDQSVWTALLKGWIRNLDPSKVEVHLFHTGTTFDGETEQARAYAETMTAGLGRMEDWVGAVASIAPDVILYPELGMDPMSARLASIRLANVQIATWGHPETSGYPTMDFYVSAEAFEPPDATSNYREQLVLLPGTGCFYEELAPDYMGIDWSALEIDPFAPRLLCAGTPYKYMPNGDAVLVELIRRVPDAQLIFFEDKSPLLSDALRRRLLGAFEVQGLDPALNIRFVPHQSRQAFFAMLRDADALLDTIGFSGFNTAMQAIECDLPIVAWEGKYMRGRLASGLLRKMGLDELVATTPEQYVAIAAKLVREPTYRFRIVKDMSLRKQVLFRDAAPIRALESFLVRVGHQR